MNFTENPNLDYCGSCNRAIRKKKEDEEKEEHKRSRAIELSEERNRRYAEKARAKQQEIREGHRVIGEGEGDKRCSSQKDSSRTKGKIRVRSPKRAKEEREYLRRREKYLTLHPECERCGCPSSEVHHRAGRTGKLLINVLYFMAVCRECHHWIELHPEQSKKQGYSVNRLTL